jgi:hypothetical protein
MSLAGQPHAREGVRPALGAFAAVAVACALGWSNGSFDPVSLGLVTAATAATLAALALGRGKAAPDRSDLRWSTAILALGVALGVTYAMLVPPGIYVPPGTLGDIRPLVAAMALVTASWLWRGAPASVVRLRFPAALALACAMGALVIVRTPAPHIDVWYFQQLGSEALLHGGDPYRVAYPNIYGVEAWVYAPAVLSADRLSILGNPYPPLTLLLGVPAAALGADVRWVALALVLFSAWAIRELGRGSVAGELAAVLLLVQPRTLFVLEQAWTEPALLAAGLVTVLLVDAWARRDAAGTSGSWAWIASGVAAGVALGAKQYAPLVLFPVLFAAPARGRWKAAAMAAAVVAATVAPFLLWDADAFVRGVVAFQLAQPFRLDALSWLAATVRLGGPILPVWPAFLLAAATLGLAIRRAMAVDQAVLAGAGAWLVLVVLNKQAFCNYYWLAGGLLCAAAAAGAGHAARAGEVTWT